MLICPNLKQMFYVTSHIMGILYILLILLWALINRQKTQGLPMMKNLNSNSVSTTLPTATMLIDELSRRPVRNDRNESNDVPISTHRTLDAMHDLFIQENFMKYAVPVQVDHTIHGQFFLKS